VDALVSRASVSSVYRAYVAIRMNYTKLHLLYLFLTLHSIGLHSGLNPVDYKIASRGVPKWEGKYPIVLGLDVAGTIDALGEVLCY